MKIGAVALMVSVALAACDRIPGADAYYIARAEKAVATNLKDPASAQFTDVTLRTIKDNRNVCGYVNAKNSYGGYVGKKRFYALSMTAGDFEPIATQIEDGDADAKEQCNFDVFYEALCSEKPAELDSLTRELARCDRLSAAD